MTVGAPTPVVPARVTACCSKPDKGETCIAGKLQVCLQPALRYPSIQFFSPLYLEPLALFAFALTVCLVH